MSSLTKILKHFGNYAFPSICYLCQSRPRKNDYFCQQCDLQQDVLNTSQRLCHSCGSYLDNNFNICSRCLPEEHSWKQGFCAYLYHSRTQLAIQQFKYHNKIILAKPLVEQMYKIIKPHINNFNCITYVPKFWLNSFTKSYNQTEILAYALSKKIKLPYYQLLKKVKWTKKQAKLDRTKRLKNTHQAFKAKKKKIRGSCILLIDDVLTTGATLNACTITLQNAGAELVYTLTISRG